MKEDDWSLEVKEAVGLLIEGLMSVESKEVEVEDDEGGRDGRPEAETGNAEEGEEFAS